MALVAALAATASIGEAAVVEHTFVVSKCILILTIFSLIWLLLVKRFSRFFGKKKSDR
jgi:hypothetical protein